MIEMPVSASPFNTVCMMGDAPRQRGSNEGWTFRMPLETLWITDTLQWQHHRYQNHLHTAMTASLVPESFAHCNDSLSLVLVLIICALQWHTDSMSLVPESFAHCNDSITGTSSNHLHIAMTLDSVINARIIHRHNARTSHYWYQNDSDTMQWQCHCTVYDFRIKLLTMDPSVWI